MKLIRFGTPNNELPGVELKDGTRIDVSTFCTDYNEDFFEDDGINKLSSWLKDNHNSCPVIDENERLGSPIARPSKIICVGLNYAKHAAESGMEIPKEPVLFFKASSSIVGPFDPIIIPKGSTKTDWEVELAVVIGEKASYIDEDEALNYIAGFMVHNDVSERAFQLERSGQWVKGKSCDSFAPLGPYLVTQEDIKDANNLDIWLKLNGETVQNSNTSDFIFNIQECLSYISQFMTLLPGDVISTGTPSGVGLGFDPPRYLKGGDELELGIEGLGISRQTCVNFQ